MVETEPGDGFEWPERRRRPILWAAAVLAALLAAAYFASPLLAIGTLKLAAKRGDQPRLEQLVDFPALRAGLKAQLAAALARRSGRDAGLAAAVLLSDSFIDAVLTPSNLAALINGAAFLPRPQPARAAPSPAAAPPAGPAAEPAMIAFPSPEPASPQVHGGYVGLNRFDVSIQRQDEKGPTVFSFRRWGLFGWRLSDIHLPPEVLARIL